MYRQEGMAWMVNSFLLGTSYAQRPDGSEKYPVTDDENLLFATDDQDRKMYAKDAHRDEYYPVKKVENGENVYSFITDENGFMVYPKREDTSEIYATRANGDEYIPIIVNHNMATAILSIHAPNTKWRYALDKNKKPRYPKKYISNPAIKEEYVVNNEIIEEEPTKRPLYPLDANGHPKYPVDSITGDEFYSRIIITNVDKTFMKNTYLFLLNKDRDEVYAKKKNGDEFYPPDNSIAVTKEKNPKYALTSKKLVVYPNDKQSEYYIQDKEGNDLLIAFGKPLDRYARDSLGNEHYPKKTIYLEGNVPIKSDIILNNEYAQFFSKISYYPLDDLNNEYTITITPQNEQDYQKIYPIGYPVTNDRFVIVPRYLNKAHIHKDVKPKVDTVNVIGKIYRRLTDTFDYRTNVKITELKRLVRSKPKPYHILSLTDPEVPPSISTTHPPKVPPQPLPINPGPSQNQPLPPKNNPPLPNNPQVIPVPFQPQAPKVPPKKKSSRGWMYAIACAVVILLIMTAWIMDINLSPGPIENMDDEPPPPKRRKMK